MAERKLHDVNVVQPHRQPIQAFFDVEGRGEVGGISVDVQVVPYLADAAMAVILPARDFLSLVDVGGFAVQRDLLAGVTCPLPAVPA
ncbi:hypothetical protein ABL843_22065 [Variovorax sp. 350MFTsu5.1]